MKTRQLLAAAILAAFSVAATAGPTSPTTFDFSNLKYNGGNASFLPNEVLNTGYWRCTGGDLCSSNIDAKTALGGDLKYTLNGITATATATYNGAVATVMQDHEDAYNPSKYIGAGLGVYHKTGDTSDDNVTFGETLKLTFSKVVTLSGISLRSDGHNTTFDANSTFVLNGTTKLKLSHDIGNLSMTGKVFTFSFDNSLRANSTKLSGDQFYLGGVTVSAVPEPETYAMMLAGLGLLGFAARRRKPVA
ncbi:FxDxF family PEP-CTERM protein [Actimicrobium antarcticum]